MQNNMQDRKSKSAKHFKPHLYQWVDVVKKIIKNIKPSRCSSIRWARDCMWLIGQNLECSKCHGETKSFKMDANVQAGSHCTRSWIFLEFAVKKVYLSNVVSHKYVLIFVLKIWVGVFCADMSFSLKF